MNNILRSLLLITMSLLVSSCLLPNEKGKVSLNLSSSDQAARDAGKESDSSLTVSNVELINDQIIVTGSDLSTVTKVKVSQSGTESILSIISQTASQLILSSSSKVGLALNTLMSLTLENAYGASVVEVTFNLPDSSVSTDKIGDEQVTTAKIEDGAITAVKLNQMSASVGQLLRWNGTSWAATDLDALTYAGTWDASVGGNPNPAAVGGEYYIVSADGTADPGDGDSRTWTQGDWIVFNNNTSAWDQITNSSDVTSFEGRTGGVTAQAGDYTWAMINKTTSSIGDIADVDLSTPATTGKVLKFDGTSWVADDDLSGGGAGSVSSSEIADGSIVDADVSGSAAIAWTKINKTGAAASDVGLGNVDNIQQMPLSYLDTTATLGSDDAKIASQNAVKTYVDNAVTGMGSVTSITGGAGLTDGPYTTTGTIDVQVDGTSLEIASDALRVKALGIGTAHLAANAVTTAKITDGNITNAKIDSVADTKITTACSDGEILSASSGTFVCSATSSAGNWTLTADPYLYYNGGNIGVGTATPDVKLHVSNGASGGTPTTTIDELRIEDDDVAGIDIYTPDISSGRINFGSPSNNRNAAIWGMNNSSDPTMSFRTENIERMRINSTGFVGIGTTSPASNLEVKGGASQALTGTVDIVSGTDTLTGTGTSFDTELNVGDAIKVGNEVFTVSAISDATNLTLDSNHSAGATGVTATSDSTLMNIINSDDRDIFTVHASGRLGVNEPSPIADLHIKHAKGDGKTATIALQGSDANTPWQVGTGNDLGKIEFYGNDSQTTDEEEISAMIMSESESTVSGATTVTGNISFHTKTLGDTSLSEKMRITASGNIGIGETNPSTELEVSGTVTATSFSGDGSNLTGITASNTAASAGTVGAPSMSFSTDSNTGFYSNGADQIGISSNGVNTFNFTTTALTSPTTGGASLTSANGSAAAPTFSFAGDEDTGWYRAADNELAASTAGSERIRIDSSGNVGIATNNPSYKLDINNYIGFDVWNQANNSDIDSLVGSGRLASNFGGIIYAKESGHLLIGLKDNDGKDSFSIVSGGGDWDTDTTYDTTVLAAQANGFVGIGTSSPTEKLEVNGTTKTDYLILDKTANSEANFLEFNIGATDQYYLRGINAANALTLGTASNGSSEIIRFEAGGDIGIGTTNPNARLHIFSSSGRSFISETSNDYVAEFKSTDPNAYIVFEDSTSTNDGNSIGVTGDDMRIRTASTERMRIDSTGNVGIGTTSPTRKLHVRSDGAYQFRLENGATGGGFWNIAQSDNTFGTSGGKLLFIPDTETSTSAAVTFENSGNVGLGTTSPSEKLDISAGNIMIDNNYALASSFTADGESSFYPYRTGIQSQAGLGSQVDQDGGMQIKADALITFAETDADKVVGFMNMNDEEFIWGGNVGVGTSSPSQKLHIVGNLRVEGSTDCILGNGSGATSCTSDRRLKDQIKPITHALEKIKSVKGVDFVWNNLARSPGRHDIGVIAQDIQKAFPTAVIENDEGYLSVDYAVLVAPLIESVKELDENMRMFKTMHNGILVDHSRKIANLESLNRELKEGYLEIKSENKLIKEQLQEMKAFLCMKNNNTNFCKR